MPKTKKIYCAPGNGGIAQLADCVDISATDLRGLVQFAKKKCIDLTVVGPEIPLTLGIVDQFDKEGLCIFGPSQKAAVIEGSKGYAKHFMYKHKIPTAEYRIFTEPDEAIRYIHEKKPPMVVKADGLAAGKGVLICRDRGEAFQAVHRIMNQKTFGDAGNRLIVEEFLEGEEASILAITDGHQLLVLPTSQDHKAIFEGDQGPNTGGMGAYAPAPVMSPKLLEIVGEKILMPTIRGMENEGRSYRGVLYAGLMMTSGGPKVLEFNCRFGDPETQAVLPLIDTDIVDIMMASIQGGIIDISPRFNSGAAVCVVMASGGYPGLYEKGKTIHGLNLLDSDVIVFHAGTKKKGGAFITSGGRVLGITAMDMTIKSAIKKAYQAVGKITFDGAYYRKDIGLKALKQD